MIRDLHESLPARVPMVHPSDILVLDDEEGVRKVLAAGLQQYGFTVWLAGDGQQAIDLYRSNAASIGMVLLDVLMSGRDGPDILHELQLLNPDVRACFLTGGSGRYSEADLMGSGAIAVFRKPVQICELAERLAGLMDRPTDAYMDLQTGRWEDEPSRQIALAPAPE